MCSDHTRCTLLALFFMWSVVFVNQPFFNPYTQQFGYYPQQNQPMQTNPFQPQPQRQPEITVTSVPTMDHVEQVQMLPGEKKIILVQNAPVMAIRIADQMGLVQTEYRKTEPFDPHAQQQQQQAQEYAPLAVVQSMQEQIQILSEELNNIKGVSSRGKSVKQSVSATADAD